LLAARLRRLPDILPEMAAFRLLTCTRCAMTALHAVSLYKKSLPQYTAYRQME